MTQTVTASMIVIGDEILSGRTKDRNIGHLADILTAIGIDLVEVRIVADDEAAIVEAVNTLRARTDYVFTTGGIGPTHDDITADFRVTRLRAALRARCEGTGAAGRELRRARHRIHRGAQAYGAHAGRGRAHRQPGVAGAGLPDRQRACDGGRAGHLPGDARQRRADTEVRDKAPFGKRFTVHSARARSAGRWATSRRRIPTPSSAPIPNTRMAPSGPNSWCARAMGRRWRAPRRPCARCWPASPAEPALPLRWIKDCSWIAASVPIVPPGGDRS